MARAAVVSCASGCVTSRATRQPSAAAARRVATRTPRPPSATVRCTAPTCASTAASVVETRTTVRPGGPPRTATYRRRSLVDALRRVARPLPSARACCTSGRRRWFSRPPSEARSKSVSPRTVPLESISVTRCPRRVPSERATSGQRSESPGNSAAITWPSRSRPPAIRSSKWRLSTRSDATVSPSTADGLDVVACLPKLLAQPLDVHVHRARLDVGLRLPYRLEQLGAALHAPLSLDQRAEQLELGRREVYLRADHGDAMRAAIEHDRAGGDESAGGDGRRGQAAQDGANPQDEFLR